MATTLNSYAAVFGQRDFRLLVTSSFIDSVGSWLAQIVLSVYIYTVTGSLTWLAAMAAASWVPGLLIAPLAGGVADRVVCRSLMLVS
ncbi:MAG: MFS transporter, partial [Salinibacterium sp.]|nr:MFS transporter [Salinibacterium sp.]